MKPVIKFSAEDVLGLNGGLIHLCGFSRDRSST